MKAKLRVSISAEEFVRRWQAAETLSGMARELGVSRQAVYIRGRRMKQVGIKLKNFVRRGSGKPWDVDGLRRLAEEHQPKR